MLYFVDATVRGVIFMIWAISFIRAAPPNQQLQNLDADGRSTGQIRAT